MLKKTLILLSFIVMYTNFIGYAQIECISGLKTGSYNRFANDIKKYSSVPIEIHTSNGSVDNFNKLVNSPKQIFTFLQYDVLIYKKYKDQENKTHYTDNIRILAPLALEEIHLIVRKDDDINSLKDLNKKRVAVGAENQGTFVTANLIKGIRNIKWIDVPIGFDEAFNALLENRVDAIFYIGYAPATKLYRFPRSTKIKLVPIIHRSLQSVYTPLIIPKGTYKWADYDVKTYGVKSVLATDITNETPETRKEIEKILRDMKFNLPLLKEKGHPKWKDVDFNFSAIKFKVYNGAIEILTR
jgi:uncharacterized protein